ncbi:30S ribosomal protein S8e [Candidatus Woesearchaeota archaeon CG10_big_fil_rev_8_21_14_0_10_37_12]|nr:MAG: 30S ribosomal protein S8e [Candidatus Woesearchaeota archaeon CG10_big_fil_rev_8_21_14_0_10_37_12]
MVVNQRGRQGRKESSGKYKSAKAKRKYEIGRRPTFTKIDETHKTKTIRTKGGSRKMRVMHAKFANLIDPKTKKASKAEITKVEECPANRHFVRRNVIVKGTIITTSAGKAKVTSRPGQDGTINAVLV